MQATIRKDFRYQTEIETTLAGVHPSKAPDAIAKRLREKREREKARAAYEATTRVHLADQRLESEVIRDLNQMSGDDMPPHPLCRAFCYLVWAIALFGAIYIGMHLGVWWVRSGF